MNRDDWRAALEQHFIPCLRRNLRNNRSALSRGSLVESTAQVRELSCLYFVHLVNGQHV